MSSTGTGMRMAALIVAASCLLIMGCVTTDWEGARQKDSLDAYSAFVVKYPSSEFTSKANDRIKALKSAQAWEGAQQKDSLDAYSAFVAEYPSSEFTSKANDRIKALKSAQAAAALARADEAGTEEAFKSVVREYPDTPAAKEAGAAIARTVAKAEIRSDVTAAWASDWVQFVAYFQRYFDKGEITADDKLALRRVMHGVTVTWAGKVESVTNGYIRMAMQSAPLRFKLRATSNSSPHSPYGRSGSGGPIWFSSGSKDSTTTFGAAITGDAQTYKAEDLTIRPLWGNRKAWARVRPGQSVRFRTVLKGTGIDMVLIGLGPNEGKIAVTWQTEDGELLNADNDK